MKTPEKQKEEKEVQEIMFKIYTHTCLTEMFTSYQYLTITHMFYTTKNYYLRIRDNKTGSEYITNTKCYNELMFAKAIQEYNKSK